MPQCFHVVKCYSCWTYQVQIVKKVKKFQCKMCGEKQSVKLVIFEGSAKDCRHIAQDKNLKKGQLFEELAQKSSESSNESDTDQVEEKVISSGTYDSRIVSGASKWDKYLTSAEGEEVNPYNNISTFRREKRELENDDDSSPERVHKKVSL
ncbi:DgyrCDS8070 [Dimorphilus gyrociliatus]|uniref:DgyrCDS8070 n=1 Tax=Dimorphilus gyrociliatus TaxID=2664684 RepID=A0A7I8VT49_9ANNE|nr:DgyrCDS8070 [Dimorphilus gyrociliatus]